jgi:hypothetical protein
MSYSVMSPCWNCTKNGTSSEDCTDMQDLSKAI